MFTRLVRTNQKSEVGDAAGVVDSGGYLLIGVCRERHRAHRLAVLYMTGEWPAETVDHINGNRTDNRWANLRSVPRELNAQNIRDSRNHRGLMGVFQAKGRKAFFAAISVNGKAKYLGSFRTPEEAHEAYLAAKRLLHPGNTL